VRWYSYIILFLFSGLFTFTQVKVLPGVELMTPEFIACFLILKYEEPRKALWTTFFFSMLFDFLISGSLISGVFTMVILPILMVGILLKEHILPTFSDLFLLGYFFVGFLVNYMLIRWLYSLFGVRIDWAPPVFLFFWALGHSVAFGAVLLALNRFTRVKA